MDVGLCRPDEVDALRRFIAEHWRADHVLAHDEALLRWQFGGLLGAEAPTVLLARDDGGTLLGMQGVIDTPLTVHGRTVRGGWLANLMAAPAARAQGAGTKLLWGSFRLGHDVLLSNGLNADMRATLPALRYEVLDALPRWVAVTDVERTAALGAVPGIAPVAAPAGVEAAAPAGVEVATVDALGAEWDAFWDERIAPGVVGTRRDAALLTWRFLAHPRFRYVVRLARRDGEVAGLAVHRVEDVAGVAGVDDLRVVRLVELVGEPVGRAALLADVVATARAADAAFVDWYGTAALGPELEAAGFVPGADDLVPSRFSPLDGGRHPIATAVRVQAKDLAGLRPVLADAGLHVTKADGDMDRPNAAPAP